LAAARAKRDSGAIKHIIVTGHYPLYAGYMWTAVLKVLEPIFIKYGVDAYVAGHGRDLSFIFSLLLHLLALSASSASCIVFLLLLLASSAASCSSCSFYE
jgi:hypothetical protein